MIFKVFVLKFLTKVAQIISNFLGYFEKPHCHVKTDVAFSWVTVGNIRLLYTSTSDHTVSH